MRMTDYDADRIRGELTRARRRAYESELTIQAARVGCPMRRGSLTTGTALSELNELSKRDAESIISTYNYDLASAIRHIASQTPTANRRTYASRLSTWEQKRATWKQRQVAQFTDGSARSQAQRDFYRLNNIEQGTAELAPDTAVCPICQGWIDRGSVPIAVAQNNPPPYHVNCPHTWVTYPDRVPAEFCQDLWMGE